MKILLVSTQDYIHHPVPSRHHYIFEELATRHEVHVPHFHVSDGPERETRLIVHEATKYPLKDPGIHYMMNAPHHYSVFKKIIREEEIDVVVAAHVLAGSAVIRAAHKYGVPVVFDLKDWFPDSAAAYYKNRLIKWALREGVWRITKYNLDRSDRIVTVSPSLVERLKGFGYDSKLITNGVNTDYFKPMDSKEGKRMLGLDEGAFVIGYVGTLENWLSLEVVIKGIYELLKDRDDIYFAVIGGALFTDYEKYIKDFIRRGGIGENVRFYGVIEYKNLPKYIAGMDVCLIPFKITPISDIALPNKFFEYSACGKPILSTPLSDVVKVGGNHLFIYDTADEFVEKVSWIMNNPEDYVINMEHYSWKSKAEEMEKLLEEVVRS